ncbi:MAG: CHAT domain-containing protein [Scytolyngbya sp. HA4215-MV1]|jgi:filamentous hemagglutinin family protein|nr:CHAT domain-containing protein [Scytolyngbya sp. HA4215-MV1]
MKSAIGILGVLLGTVPVWLEIAAVEPGWAQSITPANDGIGTLVTAHGNRFDISGGSVSNDGVNLFQSFDRFGLSQGQIANFLSAPSIQNILGRVIGGDASVIQGLIQVTGSNANLYLMNPAGIIFGANARLNVPASFTATTANSIGFGAGDFTWIGTNDSSTLIGTPTGFGFAMAQPGAIVNSGDLAVPNQQNLTLIGGTVVSTGRLSAPAGQVTIATVPGSSQVRISQVGGLLSLDLQPIPASALPIPSLSLPQLLTGGNITHATGLTLTASGQVELTGSGLAVSTGDIVAKAVNSETAWLSATQNLTLVESQLQTTEDLTLLAANMVRIRESVTTPFLAKAGRNLYIQGNQGIDILAFNHSITPFQSGGALNLVSDGVIFGDSFFSSGGNFSLLNLAGSPGRFASFYAPMISAGGDVILGDYIGVALKVEAMGSILVGGNLTITGADAALGSPNPDTAILTSSQALILRAGVPVLSSLVPPQGSGSTVAPSPTVVPGNIRVTGTIATSAQAQPGNGGPVILSAPGTITTGDINTLAFFPAAPSGNGGNVTIYAGGNLQIGNINALSGNGFGGEISLISENGSIVTGNLASFSLANGGGGNVTLIASQGNLLTGSIAAYGNLTGVGGKVSLNAWNGSISTGNLATDNNEIVVQGAYLLNQDVILTNQNSTNIDIRFNGTVNGNHFLSLNAGNGIVTFNGLVGGITPLAGANWTASLYRFAGGYITNGAYQITRPIELIGDAIFGGPNATSWGFGRISAGAHHLTIIADSIDFWGGANSVTGSGTLTLQPTIASRPITLGGTGNTPGTLSLTMGDFAALQDGFADITIGRIDGSGMLGMASAINFFDPLTLRSPQGTLNLSFPLLGQGRTSHLTLIGNTIASHVLSTGGGNINIQTGPTGQFANFGKVSSHGGDITIAGVYDFFNDLDSQGGNFNLNANGQISAPITLRTGGANLNFNGTVGNHGQVANTLTLDLGSGNLFVAADLTPNTLVTQANHVTVNGSVLNGFTQLAGTGTSTFRGSIFGTGLTVSSQNVVFDGAIDVAGPVNLIASQLLQTQDIQAWGQNVSLQAAGLHVGNINTSHPPTGLGNAGAISLVAIDGDIMAGNLSAVTQASAPGQTIGNAGTVSLNAIGNLTTGNILAFSINDANGNAGLGGNIHLIAQTGNITTGEINASSRVSAANGVPTGVGNAANGGTISLNATGSIVLQGNLAATSITQAAGTAAAGGFINLTAHSITGTDFDVSANSQSGQAGAGGMLLLNANTIGGNQFNANSSSQTGMAGNAGTLWLNGAAIQGNHFSAASMTQAGTVGSGGTIALTARDRLIVGGVAAQGSAGTGNIALTSNEIDLVGGSRSVRGNGSLLLQPFDPDQSIRVGASNNTRSLDLNTTDWLALADGFSLVQIGRNNGTGDMTIASIVLTDPTLFSTPNGNITLTGGLSLKDNGSASFASRQLPTTLLTTDITTADPLTFFGNIQLDANIRITATSTNPLTFAGNINGAHHLTFNASNSTLLFQGAIGNETPLQGLSITAQNAFFTNQVTTHGDITLNSTTTLTQSAAIVARSGSITATGTLIGQNAPVLLTADDAIRLEDVFSEGGIALSSDATLTAHHLRAPGQPIIVQAKDSITLGRVDSSASVGNGGSVWLDPHGNIVVHSINTQGGANGVGGNVDISTDRFFLATGSFVDRNGILASISTAGGTRGGSITIHHGGSNAVAFNIGNPSNNGTVGAITGSADNTIAPTQSYSRSIIQNNIRILTQDPPEPQKVVPKPMQIFLPVQTLIPNTTIATTPPPMESSLSTPEKNFSKQFAQYLGNASDFQPLSAQNITQTLDNITQQTQTRPAILYVFAHNEQLELVLFMPGMKPISKNLPVADHQTLMAVVKTFVREVSDPRKTRTTSYLASAQQLYRWMIAPIAADLQAQNIDTLLFAMDNGLRSIPMAALHDGHQFLVQKYRLALIPSLSLTNTHYEPLTNAQVLAMGASTFRDQPPLPAVPVELSSITHNLWDGEIFLNQTFTLKNLKLQRQERPYQIIHLATHGEFQGGNSRNSYIQLWDTQLQLNQLRDLGWSHPPVELLVLSACQTAFGNEQAELGFAGIAFQAGVKSVLASLWYVSDEGTLGLMTEFYRQLKTARIKAEALQKAQIAMLTGQIKLEDGELQGPWQPYKLHLPAEFEHRQANLSHPFYWAAFTLIGSPW